MAYKIVKPTGTAGSPATAANTGFYFINDPAPATATIDAAAGYAGLNGVTLVSSTAATNIIGRATVPSNLTQEIRGVFSVDSTALTAEMTICQPRTGTNAGSGFGGARLALDTSKRLKVYDNGTNQNLVYSTALAPGDYEFYAKFIVATSTTGQVVVSVYNRGSNSALGSYTSPATWNLGSTAITGWDVGLITSTGTTSHTMHICPVQFNDGTPINLNAIATPTAAFTSSISGLAVTVVGSSSTANTNGVTLTSYDWDWGDGSPHGSGATPAAHTYTAGTYTIVLTVTDSNGLTATVSHSVTVSTASYTPNLVLVTETGYTTTGGSDLTVLTDASQTTFQTIDAPSGTLDELSWGPCNSPTSGSPLQLVLNMGRYSSSSGTVTVTLYENGTLRSTQSGIAVPTDSTSGQVDNFVTINFPWADVSAITFPTASGALVTKVAPTVA